MEAVGSAKLRDLGTRRDADRVHHGRTFRADRSQDQGATEGGTCCGESGCCRFRRCTFRISDGGDAQLNGDGAEAVPDGLARPIEDHEGVAGSGVAVDDLVSSVGFIREVGDSADCRELLKGH